MAFIVGRKLTFVVLNYAVVFLDNLWNRPLIIVNYYLINNCLLDWYVLYGMFLYICRIPIPNY
jgi:hypothetical protein